MSAGWDWFQIAMVVGCVFLAALIVYAAWKEGGPW